MLQILRQKVTKDKNPQQAIMLDEIGGKKGDFYIRKSDKDEWVLNGGYKIGKR